MNLCVTREILDAVAKHVQDYLGQLNWGASYTREKGRKKVFFLQILKKLWILFLVMKSNYGATFFCVILSWYAGYRRNNVL